MKKYESKKDNQENKNYINNYIPNFRLLNNKNNDEYKKDDLMVMCRDCGCCYSVEENDACPDCGCVERW